MELTEALKSWAVEHLEVAKDASDDEFRQAILAALGDGKLDAATFAKLLAGEGDAKQELADLISASVATGNQQFAELQERTIAALEKIGTAAQERQAAESKKDAEPDVKAAVEKEMANWREPEQDDPNIAKLYAGMAAQPKPTGGQPRVIKAIERYSGTKSRMIYPKRTAKSGAHLLADEEVCGENGEPVDSLSEQELAVCGAFLKAQVPRYELTDHEKDLLLYAAHEVPWSGDFDVGYVEKGRSESGMVYKGHPHLPRWMGKTQNHVINGTTSGGNYAVPTPLDALVIMEPLLYGELFPLCTLRTATANSVNGFTIGKVSVTSNAGPEGTALTLFDCTGLVSNLDTTIYPVACGIRLGLDWLSDTPVNFAQVIQRHLGEVHMEWLDNQIANGDGTTEIEGIFTKSGTASVSSQGGTAGPYQTADAENLCFGVSKARRKRGRCAYVMSDTAYKRYRQIITASNYQTRALGMDHQSYKILEYDAKIQNDINVAYSAFCDFTDFLLYRRLGAQFRTSTEGETLMKANLMLLTFRARWGGQLALAAACAVCTDGDSSEAI